MLVWRVCRVCLSEYASNAINGERESEDQQTEHGNITSAAACQRYGTSQRHGVSPVRGNPNVGMADIQLDWRGRSPLLSSLSLEPVSRVSKSIVFAAHEVSCPEPSCTRTGVRTCGGQTETTATTNSPRTTHRPIIGSPNPPRQGCIWTLSTRLLRPSSCLLRGELAARIHVRLRPEARWTWTATSLTLFIWSTPVTVNLPG